MVSPPEKLGIPLLVNLYTNPTEDVTKPDTASWVIGPILKAVGAYEQSLKRFPNIEMGSPDPYHPPPARG